MPEKWRRIPGFDPAYEVSDRGRVRTWKVRGRGKKLSDKPTLMSPAPNGSMGYLRVCIRHDGKSMTVAVSSLVLFAFHGPRPEGKESCHKNGDPTDNRSKNLYWGTHVENCRDRVRHGRAPRGERHGLARLSDDDVREIRRRFKLGDKARVIAGDFKISHPHVLDIAKRKRWAHVS